MAYVSADGTIKEKNDSILTKIWAFFAMILYFFQTLIGFDFNSGSRSSNDHRDHLRRQNPGGGGRYDGAALGGGGGGNGGFRRNIGRLPSASGVAPPPMGGGCCGGGGCG